MASKTRVEYIDKKIQRGRGKAARIIGQTYNVFRLLPTTTGSIITSSPLYPNFPARLNLKPKKAEIENAVFDLQVFSVLMDNRPFLKGDVFVETGYKADPSGCYTLAQFRPTRETIWVRTESKGTQIFRPHPAAGASSDQPVTGIVARTGQGVYSGVSQLTSQSLTLDNGEYSFDNPSGTLASVPCGMQPRVLVRDATKPDIPTAFPRTHYLAYLPSLPGVQILPNMEIKYFNGQTYITQMVFSTGDTGLAGYICVCELKAT